jgi:RNA polymerase sigma-70 factor (ECF subfamily)
MTLREAVSERAQDLLQETTWLRGLVVHVMGNARDADDVVQDVRLAALAEGSPPRSVRGWLAAVVRHTVQRRRLRARLAARHEPNAARPEATASAHDVVARVEAQRSVVDAVLALDEPYRTAVLLRYFEGRKPKDIARALGCPVATVRTRLARGLALLRGRLETRLGARDAWPALFGFELVRLPVPLVLDPVTTGVVMGVHKKVMTAAAAALVVSASVVLWPASSNPDDGARDDATGALANAGAAEVAVSSDAHSAAAAPAHRSVVAVSSADEAESPLTSDAPAASGELVVWVLDGEGRPVARAQVLRVVPSEEEPSESELVTKLVGPTDPSAYEPHRTANAFILQLDEFRQQKDLARAHQSPRALALAESLDTLESAVARSNSVTLQPRVKLFGFATARRPRPIDNTLESPPLAALGRTDREGRLRLRHTDALTLIAITSSHATSGLAEFAVPDGGGEIVLVVRPSCAVQGTVVDAAGRPLAGARLRALPRAENSLRARAVTDVATDARGQFALRLDAPFAFRLFAEIGEQRSEELHFDATPGRELNASLRMLGAVTLLGTVRDPQGAVCAGAEVHLTRLDRDRAADARTLHFRASASCDDAGAFRILLPSAGSYGVVARHDAWGHSELRQLDAAQASVRAIDLHLRAPCAVFGTVRWNDGHAIEGAQLTLTPRPGPVPHGLTARDLVGGPATVDVGADGSYRFATLTPGITYDLVCVPDPARAHTKIVRTDIVPAQQDFVLDRQALLGASVRLFLEPSNGASVTSTSILVSRRAPDGTWVRGDSQDVTCIRPNELLVEGLEGGVTYAIELLGGDFGRCRCEPFVAGVDRERVLRPQPPGRLEVVVLDAKGKPVFAAKVVAREEAQRGLGRADSSKHTDVRGVASWPSISVLPWSVWAEHQGKRTAITPVVLRPNELTRIELRWQGR